MSPKRRATAKGAKTAADPFLFVGHGFGTSARCLECYAWFARPPAKRDRVWIARQLPSPVASFARFDRALLHFGSDDDLEARIVAAYHPASDEPQPAHWKAFCSDFERAMRRIHDRHALIAVVKPDDGAHGRKPSAWHRRSLARADELVERAASMSSKANDAWSGLARNLREEVTRPPKGELAARPESTKKVVPSTDGKAMLRAALDALVVPRLRESGFEGSFPRLRRITKARTQVVWFELESGAYASASVGFAALAPRKDTSLKEDYDRAFGIRNRHRWLLSDLVEDDERALFWYETAAAKWGASWPKELAGLIVRVMETQALLDRHREVRGARR